LLPRWVATAEGPVGQIPADPWPQEAELAAGAVRSRQAEFAAGRALARAALSKIGGPDAPILRGPKREPVWPAGFTGSITHTRTYAAAAVARTTDAAAIGVDMEDWTRLRAKLEPSILNLEEIEALPSDASRDRQIAAAAIFSAKESFYKCQYPLTLQYLGFHDAKVELFPREGAFRLVCLAGSVAEALGQSFKGRYAVSGDLVATAMVIRREGKGRAP
jgi:4'-phosphopantetheinyl transferase EntD